MRNLPYIIKFFMLASVSLLLILLSLMVGRYGISFAEMVSFFKSLFADSVSIKPQVSTVILNVRLPRVWAAFLVGGTLSITGAAYQGMFRNPMVSPSILGVSAGAGFGAALAILLGLNSFMLQVSSFIFGTGAVAAVYAVSLAAGKKYDRNLTLILSGLVVATVFSALISILKYIADPDDTLPSIVYWLMGGLSGIEMADLRFIVVIAAAGLILLTMSGWKLDMMSFGDDEAKTMGINVDRFRFWVIAAATLLTASAVSISGIIGWVGLLVPHTARMLVGSKNSVLLPASFFTGGVFLLIVDDFSRTVAPMEIPLGITTSLIGAPFFIFVLMRSSKD